MRVVRIEWHGPYTLEDARALNDKEQDYGVYQVYGEHVVFGEGTLLYIGVTRDQTFGRRLSQQNRLFQQNWLVEEDNEIEIVVGRIAESDYKHDYPDRCDWSELLRDVEALEIYWHSPPYNSKNIIDYHGQPLILINEGERASLSAACESDETPYYIEFAYIDEFMREVSKESRLERVTVAIRSSGYRGRFFYKERGGYLLQKPVF